MKMFPGAPSLVPSMFPVFPRRIRAFSVFWISCLTYMSAMLSILNYIQQPGTLRTLGTGLKRHDFGLGRAGNKTRNSGNELVVGTGRCGRRSV
jgi:hypothetical protein